MANVNPDRMRELVDEGKAMPGKRGDAGRFLIRNENDLRRAVRAVSGSKDGHTRLRRHILKRAKALGRRDLVPDTWRADGTLKS